MATDTPNFNWPIPEDTDLVKDGAKAIRDLGNAIDTSAQDFGGGLVHIETQIFSAVSAVNFSNDVFNSSFRKYKFIWDCTHSTSSTARMRFRTAGSDNSTPNYFIQALSGLSSTASAFASSSQTDMGLSGSTTTTRGEVLIFNPNLSVNTFNIANTFGETPEIRIIGQGFNDTTVFDSMTLFPATGNITGQMSIFGIKD